MNTETVHYLNIFLGLGAIVLQIFSVIALGVLFFGPKKNIFLDFVEEHFLIVGFLVALFSSLFSLVYSEIIGFLPCQLCWYQRIFLFPQVFIFGMALWEKNKKIIKYAMPLLSVGFIISVYQNFIYYFGESSSLPCDASGVSCYKQLVSEFGGYISIPMLALTAFLAIGTLLLVAHFYKKENL
ncbi:MAG: disulfide bond formation protein B [Candidatus Nomurabacteria bacterium]|nr:disulfide bond formation protein B [Candidatus Nomurabacteria bacterium]